MDDLHRADLRRETRWRGGRNGCATRAAVAEQRAASRRSGIAIVVDAVARKPARRRTRPPRRAPERDTEARLEGHPLAGL